MKSIPDVPKKHYLFKCQNCLVGSKFDKSFSKKILDLTQVQRAIKFMLYLECNRNNFFKL